jgi:hypothetical protein
MARPPGRNVWVSPPRGLVGDFLHFGQQQANVTIARQMKLSRVVAARASATPRPSWSAIFTKAYAVVAARCPALRRAYMPLPWPRFYEYPLNVASVVVQRPWHGEESLFLGCVRSPETRGLIELHQQLRRLKEASLSSIKRFRLTRRLSRWPWFIRRFVMGLAYNLIARRRARHFGTFGVTSVAALGAEAIHPISLWTSYLHHGVIAPDGAVWMRLTFDHRVLDGLAGAQALADMEVVLHGEILDELCSLHVDKHALTSSFRKSA